MYYTHNISGKERKERLWCQSNDKHSPLEWLRTKGGRFKEEGGMMFKLFGK